jgi:ATP-dependent Lon protease
MARDNKSKKGGNKDSTRDKKRAAASDDDDSSSSSGSENEMDAIEYRKFLADMFPSKYSDKKVKRGEKLKSKLAKHAKKKEESEEEEEVWETESEEEEEVRRRSTKKKGGKEGVRRSARKTNKVVYEDYVSDEDSDYVPPSDEDDDEEEDQKVNIIFTIGGDEDYDDEDEDEDDADTEDEDVSVSSASDDEEDEDLDDTEEDDSSQDTELVRKKSKSSSCCSKKKTTAAVEPKTADISSSPCDSIKDADTLVKLKAMLESDKNNAMIKQCISVCEAKIKLCNAKSEKKEKKQKDKNLRIFKKILKDKNTDNDFSFYDELTTENQKRIIKELREINKVTRIEKPYRISLLESNIPVKYKAAAMKKINALRGMEPGSGEYYKIKTWIDTFMKIPFNKYSSLDVSLEDGVDKCHAFMEDSLKTLDKAAFGLNDAKLQIMQMLGQLLTNPRALGTSIGIYGPPGTGKTSLVKEGISKILKRPFAFIPLGGASDGAYLTGHGVTYEGSVWGKIVQAIIDAGSMEIVFFFDEIDKISGTPKGAEIEGILTHLIDTTQNSEFHDSFFCDIDFDLSKCFFIFSYNDETLVNPILRDRMYKIQTKGYNQAEKTIIANQYLLPKLMEQVKFAEGQIIIPDAVIHYIVDNFCHKEDGVRNMKRCLEIIYTKLNLYRLMKTGINLFETDMSLKVDFPFTITKEIVDKLLKKKEAENVSALYSMYM